MAAYKKGQRDLRDNGTPPYTSEERTQAKNMFCAGPLLDLFIDF